MPELLKVCSYEELIQKSVAWIASANSLAMLLYLGLAFIMNPWLAAGIAIFFHYMWYHYNSSLVLIRLTPVLTLINKDFFQLTVAAVLISYMGITGMHLAAFLGIFCFFLFKTGLLRLLWDKFQTGENGKKLSLNDSTLKTILVHQARIHNLPQKNISNMDQPVPGATPGMEKNK